MGRGRFRGSRGHDTRSPARQHGHHRKRLHQCLDQGASNLSRQDRMENGIGWEAGHRLPSRDLSPRTGRMRRSRGDGYTGPFGSKTPKNGGCRVCLFPYVHKNSCGIQDKQGQPHGFCTNQDCPRSFAKKNRQGNVINAEDTRATLAAAGSSGDAAPTTAAPTIEPVIPPAPIAASRKFTDALWSACKIEPTLPPPQETLPVRSDAVKNERVSLPRCKPFGTGVGTSSRRESLASPRPNRRRRPCQ